jgi:hypothetical protein
MGRGWAIWALLVGAGGCGSGTTLLLGVSTAGGVPEPASLRVAVYGAGLIGARTVSLAGARLPGTLDIAGLDAAPLDVRVQVDGLDGGGQLGSQQAVRVTLTRGAETRADVTLGAPLPDGDGDGVPDAIDDCPAAFDPDQRCAPGDASVDLTTGGGDFAGADFAGPRDFAVPRDLATTPPPDLAFPFGDGGAPPCPSYAVFCDDFESGDFSKWSSVNQQNGATCVVDTSRPLRGTYSAHASGNGPASPAGADAELISSVGTSDLTLRFYAYASALPGQFGLLAEIFRNSDNSAFSVGTNGAGAWVISEVMPGGAATDHISTTLFTANTWHCVETQATAAGRVKLWIDNAPVVDVASVNGVVQYDVVQVGYPRVPTGATAQVWVDDVAIAPQRIGCE